MIELNGVGQVFQANFSIVQEMELPDPKDPKIPIASNVVDKINKTAKKHVHTVSHGTSSQSPYLKISATEKAVVCTV